VLSRELVRSERVHLTLAINGYDDGLSTGEVRRFLGDCLGPSDFRKNASRLAADLKSCDERLPQLLDLRLPDDYTADQARAAFALLRDPTQRPGDEFQKKLQSLASGLERRLLEAVSRRLAHFEQELTRTGYRFSFADCSVGNLAFAGCFLEAGRRFNSAVDDYAQLLGLEPGLVENVTDGSNACLVAVDRDGNLVATEAEIVASERPQHLRDIYLVNRLITPEEKARLAKQEPAALQRFLASVLVKPAPNPRLLSKIAEADIIVYAPGTQHSSLFPSYLTPGIGRAIARNLHAVKVLITNLHEDAEISGASAVDLVDKALYYLREKGQLRIPTPCLITHYLINDPGQIESGAPYVPLGHLESLEDPRLVRIGNYEDGVTGRHDATKVLTPFIKSFLRRDEHLRLAVLLVDAESLNKTGQTIVEMVRAGIGDLPVVITLFYEGRESFDSDFTASLPFDVRQLSTQGATPESAFSRVVNDPGYDYVLLFESSGMYKGEDIVNLARHLRGGRLDAVWGSRRLSVNDIKEAYRLVYRSKTLKSAVSYVGSHVLSLAYLALYGRYVSDTLSGARAIRTVFLRAGPYDYRRRDFNQTVLSLLLRQRAEVFETPVYYFPISPEKVRRTTIGEGLGSLLTMLRLRWSRLPTTTDGPSDEPAAAPTPVLPGDTVSLPK
jgi:2-phospho-L-lactate transferase/gluconeogenesis factor (CofD/UPF0052 family)